MSFAENLSIMKQVVAQRVPEAARAAMEVFLTHTMYAESEGKLNAHAPKKSHSTASGLYGFIDGNKKAYNYGTTAESQSAAAVQMTLDNRASLKAFLKREPDAGELYLAHFAGDSGAIKVLKASDNTPIAQLLTKSAMDGNADNNLHGKPFKNFTAYDLREWAANKMNSSIQARVKFQTETDDGVVHSDEENKQEVVDRKKLLTDLGVPDGLAQLASGDNILGKIFFSILEIFLGKDVLEKAEKTQAIENQNTIVMPKVPAKVQMDTLTTAPRKI